MATFTHEVSPYKRRDGTYLIKVRMTHNRKTIRKPTGIYARADQLTKDKTKIKDPALLEAVRQSVDRLRMAAARVEGSEFMDAATLWKTMEARLSAERGFRLDLRAFAATLTARMEKGTADGYEYALRAFCAFLGRDSCDINEIDRAMVEGFRDWLEKKHGKGCRCASAYLEKLRYIHNRAKELYNDDDTGFVRIPRSPFKKGTIPAQPQPRHKALSLNELKKVLNVTPTTARGRIALDVFKLQIYLMGMDTVDLYQLRKCDLKDGVVTYHRAKTDSRRQDKAEMRVRLEPEAAAIVTAYKGVKGLLSFADRYATFGGFNWSVNKGLKEVAKLAGLPTLASKWARHTWATLARNECGLGKDTVAECLNHAGGTVTDVYIAKDWARLWDANRTVLDLLK